MSEAITPEDRPERAAGGADPAAEGLPPDVRRAVEAILFLADEPLTARRIAEVCKLDTPTARKLVAELNVRYDADGTPFQAAEVAGGYQLLTRPAYHPWLTRLRRTGHDLRLTPAALETLTVIAYKQPVMRAEVEAVRGVNCGEIIRLLMERGLVRTAAVDPVSRTRPA